MLFRSKNYLAKRPDRDQFYYFRYVDQGQPDYYTLTYGAFDTVSQALDALKKSDFQLPDSVKVEPKRFHDYQSHIVDSNGDQEIEGGTTVRGKVYAVSLHQVVIPVAAPPTVITNTNEATAAHGLTSSITVHNPASDRDSTGPDSTSEVSIRSTPAPAESAAAPQAPAAAKSDSSIKDPFN